jgi:hypothetical protein
MISKNEQEYLNKTFNALKRAQRYGKEYDVRDYTFSEPYCYLNRHYADKFHQIAEGAKYYSGKMEELRRLRVFP